MNERNLLPASLQLSTQKQLAWKLSGRRYLPRLPAAATFAYTRCSPRAIRNSGRRRSDRIALFQFGREKDLFRRRPQPIYPLQQKTGGGGAQLISRLVNRCQGRICELGELKTIKTCDRQVFRTSQAKFTSRLQHTKSHQIVACKNSSRAREHPKEPKSCLVAARLYRSALPAQIPAQSLCGLRLTLG